MEALPYLTARYERACEGKERHPTEAAASAALKVYQDAGTLRTASGLHPYECEFCREWHLGH